MNKLRIDCNGSYKICDVFLFRTHTGRNWFRAHTINHRYIEVEQMYSAEIPMTLTHTETNWEYGAKTNWEHNIEYEY